MELEKKKRRIKKMSKSKDNFTLTNFISPENKDEISSTLEPRKDSEAIKKELNGLQESLEVTKKGFEDLARSLGQQEPRLKILPPLLIGAMEKLDRPYQEQEKDDRPVGDEEILQVLPTSHDASRGEVDGAGKPTLRGWGVRGGSYLVRRSNGEGCRFNGRPPVSKTGCGGSNPSASAIALLSPSPRREGGGEMEIE